MKFLQQSFSVPYQYKVFFTKGLFDAENGTLGQTIDNSFGPKKVLFVLDQGVVDHHPLLTEQINGYVKSHKEHIVELGEHMFIPGGEQCKNDYSLVERLIKTVNDFGIDRHSYIVAIGGGSVLDMVGFAAAVSHRGIRLIRVPTTVLSQNDSGVGVKNGVNAYRKKNFIGSFAPPSAVINDKDFLTTLEERDWRSGIAEGIKVGLIKDGSFFDYIENSVEKLNLRDMPTMDHLIYRCAELHLKHIASGDPFEMGSSRPLDFGHWSAHKLEQITGYDIRHGEAVALGMSLDAIYSWLEGRLAKPELERILQLMVDLKFEMFHSGLNDPSLIEGLQEFQEHLGGQLTVMLLSEIGKGVEVHKIDHSLVEKSIKLLEQYYKNHRLDS